MWTYSSGPRGCIGRELSLASKFSRTVTIVIIVSNAIFIVAVMKTVLVDVYTRYTTRLLNEDRVERRPWEGADRMTELQFECLLACAEGEHIEKRGSRTQMVQDMPYDGANEMMIETSRRPSMFQTNDIAPDMTDNVGRRPSVFAPNITHNEISHLCGNSDRQPSLFSPDFSLLQPPKNDEMGRRTSYFPPDCVYTEQDSPKPSPPPTMLPIWENYGNASAPAQRKPSLLPSLIAMGPASKRVERVERAVLAEKADNLQKDGQAEEPQQRPTKGPLARAKRPALMHRSTAPDRVAGVLELVGQSAL